MSKTYTKTFPNGNRKPSESTFTVTPGRFSVATCRRCGGVVNCGLNFRPRCGIWMW